MRRSTVIILLLIMALAWVAPVVAQEGFSPEEQTALDEVRAALESLTGANTYTADITQKTVQVISIDYSGQSLLMDQTMTTTGSLQYESMHDNQYDNQQVQMTQTVQSTMTGAQNADQTIGPIDTQIIVVDDHIYLRVEPPEDLQAYYPRGWQDVTGGADAFPGMGMFNIDSIVSLGNITGPEYAEGVISAVRTVVVLEPETVGARTANHYRLGLDPRQALETVGAANVEQMFNADQSPFDVPKFIELLFNDEDTRYNVDVLIFADDQTLYSVSAHMTIDLTIPPGLLTDPSLSGADMSFKQDVVQIVQISGTDVPVSIQAPELGQ
jgi:hypothetical protein